MDMQDGADGVPIDRDGFLAGLEDAKIREMIWTLGDHPYDFEQLFPLVKGWGARGDVKRRVRWLRGVERRYELLLYPDEVIEYVTKGMLNSWMEQFFVGWVSNLLNQTLFLFTNYRVILLNCDGKGRPKQMMWQIPYDGIKRFKGGGFLSSSTSFKLKDGRVYRFAGVRKQDRKLLNDYVSRHVGRVNEVGKEFPSHGARDALCPRCCSAVEANTYDCAECGERFIEPKTPALLSLVLPCLGDFYMGHWGLGMIEVIGYVGVWMFVALNLLEGTTGGLVTGGVALAFAHGVDGAVTYAIAGKGLVLKRTAWRSH